jgi:acetyl-CoA carboxylase carboxyltransferase component
MFDTGKRTYKSDLQLGEKYRDKTTGLAGHCVAIHFYEHACERATLRYVDSQQNVQEVSFDAPELVLVATGETARATKTGGPARATGRRP